MRLAGGERVLLAGLVLGLTVRTPSGLARHTQG